MIVNGRPNKLVMGVRMSLRSGPLLCCWADNRMLVESSSRFEESRQASSRDEANESCKACVENSKRQALMP